MVRALTHCTMLLGINFEEENVHKIILDFIDFFDRKYVTI